MHFRLLFSALQILPGNSNTYAVANNTLTPAIFASKIRILPYSEHPRTVCLRLELIGCDFKGEILDDAGLWAGGFVVFSMGDDHHLLEAAVPSLDENGDFFPLLSGSHLAE